MKKSFALLTAVVMVVCLCACGGNSGNNREDNSNALIGEWIGKTNSAGQAEKYTFYETGDAKYEFLSDNKTAWFRMGTYKVLSESELRVEIPGITHNFSYVLKGKTLTLTENSYGDTYQYTKVN